MSLLDLFVFYVSREPESQRAICPRNRRGDGDKTFVAFIWHPLTPSPRFKVHACTLWTLYSKEESESIATLQLIH